MARRPDAVMNDIRDKLVALVSTDRGRTVRHYHYKAANVLKIVEQTEHGYDVIIRQLLKLRIEGRIPWEWVVDEGREVSRPLTFDSAHEALQHRARTYRQSVWADLDIQPWVFLEKDALFSIAREVADEFDVPTALTRLREARRSNLDRVHFETRSRRPAAMGDPAGLAHLD